MAANGMTMRFKRTTLIISVFVVFAIIWYRLIFRGSGTSGRGIRDAALLFEKKEVDVTKLPELMDATEKELSAFKEKEETIVVAVGKQKLKIYSLQTMPGSAPKQTVLLLHGLGDSSHDWQKVDALRKLAYWGYRAVAIDLPGYGKSADAKLTETPLERFLQALVEGLGPLPVVIVAPSMAGSFALPYLFQTPDVSAGKVAGFVAVSPVRSEKFVSSYPKSQVRTLLLYGKEDIRLGKFSRNNMDALPRSHVIEIPHAAHACFKEQPELFHRALYHYLRYLEK